ncbi:MAG: glutaredoxin family protein [Burkholderiales bacterium]
MRSVIFAVLLGAACAASAQLYRWTDEKGRVHVTDTPPPPSAKDVRKRALDTAPAAASGAAQPYAVQLAAKNYPVTLFTAPECAPCGLARTLLNQRGVPFREVSVVGEQESEQLRKAVGSLSVPAVVVGTSTLKGFEPGAYHSLLDVAGYPRTGIVPPRSQAEPKPAPAEPAASEAPPAEEAPAGPYKPR